MILLMLRQNSVCEGDWVSKMMLDRVRCLEGTGFLDDDVKAVHSYMYVPFATAILPDKPPVSDQEFHPQVYSMKNLCSRLGLDGKISQDR